ncbi:PREDICTED: S-type anion channel SLAH2-like [Nicotiana attenuata]|uniref:S-type anion channel slah3 n=1 Tax=Nicotiana attenuata TaxID=49451 RepID=A0A1J6KHA1_NICAT|nr:PREDICTED: S-type anion channel SLAH2-like [Nicotiana attenuata]XP_019239138.1 PREDICTED: S-type anion channel SLAH2-like [Nicotiana attenuata]OIT21247.1 s-type anion channel slah3 [Nicotiana attenuata]
METSEVNDSARDYSTEVLPPLIKFISDEMDDFDIIIDNDHINNHLDQTGSNFVNSSIGGTEAAAERQHERKHSVSISMPPSPLAAHSLSQKGVVFSDNNEIIFSNIDTSNFAATSTDAGTRHNKKVKFYSQPMPRNTAFPEAPAVGKLPSYSDFPSMNTKSIKQRDPRFNSFKTWSGKLERQLTNLRGKNLEAQQESNTAERENIPVHRYFDALEGPELDTLRASEQSILPEDKKWPFLLRFPVSSFGICLGVSSQAIMWKALATSPSTKFLHVSLNMNLVLWCISVALMAIVAFIYALKIIFYFEAVRREYYHPIRVNFFFAPWIALLFLALGVPPSVTKNLHTSLWYILMTPIFCLELKIYGQWMSGGQRRLSKVASPVNHLSVVGNFVGALLGASMGLKEGPIFFYAVGLAHYLVLFVTLYQRLPTNETLPKELHPVFFLFVAAPSVASMAWAAIQGSFDYGSRISYFIALFLYFSLAVRINFFRGFRFSLAWWAYTFPMTGAAIATVRYSTAVTNTATKCLAVILCSLATLTVTALLVTTIIYAFVLRDLFPNDISIAISERRHKTTGLWHLRRFGSSDANDIEQYLKFVDSSDGKDIEASLTHPNSSTIELSNEVRQQ